MGEGGTSMPALSSYLSKLILTASGLEPNIVRLQTHSDSYPATFQNLRSLSDLTSRGPEHCPAVCVPAWQTADSAALKSLSAAEERVLGRPVSATRSTVSQCVICRGY